jgi:hypothetical protein
LASNKRPSDPRIEKSFCKRLLTVLFSGRTFYLLSHPLEAFSICADRWWESRHKDCPLLVPTVIEFLGHTIQPDWTGFEWGSGGSTVWFAERTKHVTSVEDNSDWHRYVNSRLAEKCLNNVDLRLTRIDPALSDECTSSDQRARSVYVRQISDFRDEFFDYVLVDGHFREECIRAAIGKLKVGGLLILDDSLWLPTLDGWGVPEDWEIVCHAGSLTKQTTVWQRR